VKFYVTDVIPFAGLVSVAHKRQQIIVRIKHFSKSVWYKSTSVVKGINDEGTFWQKSL